MGTYTDSLLPHGGLIFETTGPGILVEVSSPDADVIGRIVKGCPVGARRMSDGRTLTLYDLDSPFTMIDEDGGRVRVTNPWNCAITDLED